MTAPDLTHLLAENAELRLRLEEAEETLAAIQSGSVDALVVGEDIYTLDRANAVTDKLHRDVLAQMEDAVVGLDNENHIIYLNAAAERQYGLPASQALGNPRDLLCQDIWLSASDQVAATASLEQHGACRSRTVQLKRNGDEIHVESSVSVLRDHLGQVSGRLEVIRDVSESHRAEARIRSTQSLVAQRERQFSTLVENSPDIFARIDRDLRHIYVSPVIERYGGLPASDYVGKTCEALGLDPELCARWNAAVEQVFTTGRPGNISVQITTPASDERFLQARLVPEFTEDGRVESVLAIATDFTERERMDAALRESQARLLDADRRKDEFLATLAHELRNPLAPIRNALEIMRLSKEAQTQEKARHMIERQLLQMVHLVDDLMDVSRITQGKVELRRERIDLALAIQNAIDTSRPLVDARHHVLDVHLPAPNTLFVHADVTRLIQIVSNLLNNAAKYTPESGHITLTAQQKDHQAIITIQDTGTGIPANMLPRVFDMFTQVDRALERSQGGLGIGLALVRKLVEMHGGAVQARSPGLGGGSTFEVQLPTLAATPGQDAHLMDDSTALDATQTGPNVLVVDDNVDSAESLATMLGLMGCQTRMAHDGLEAVKAAQAFQPNVVMLDIGLPLLTGHEVARRIRAQPWGQDMVLVALTGWGQDEDRRKSHDAGFNHHMVKPVDLDALGRLIMQHKLH